MIPKKTSLLALLALFLSVDAFAQADVSAFFLDKQQYPKAYAAWGGSGIQRINALLQPAGDLLLKSSDCKKISELALSNEFSNPQKKKIVLFADCQTTANTFPVVRYYLTEEEIQSGRVPVSDRESAQTVSEDQMKNACIESIKAKHSKGFKRFPASERVEWSQPRPGRASTRIPFDSQGLTYKAECLFHAGKLVQTTIEPR